MYFIDRIICTNNLRFRLIMNRISIFFFVQFNRTGLICFIRKTDEIVWIVYFCRNKSSYRDFKLTIHDVCGRMLYIKIWDGVKMSVCYNRLWKLLIDKNLKKTDLKHLSGISSNVLAKLGKNEPVAIDSLEKLCVSLNCNIEDIMEFVSEDAK